MNYLIVVDMQNDFISGTLGTKEAQSIVPAVAEKIKSFDGEVLFTLDTHEENYLATQEGKNLPVAHCIRGTVGWDICDALQGYVAGAVQFEKNTFGSAGLAEYLSERKNQIDSIELVGLCTDICVISNALLLKAFLPETEILVDAKCCAGVTLGSHQNALCAMQACQIKILNG